MNAPHTFPVAVAPTAPVYPEIAAFAATLRPNDPLYWPALAAADGCDASLAELNAMLLDDDCHPFAAAHLRSTAGMGGGL